LYFSVYYKNSVCNITKQYNISLNIQLSDVKVVKGLNAVNIARDAAKEIQVVVAEHH